MVISSAFAEGERRPNGDGPERGGRPPRGSDGKEQEGRHRRQPFGDPRKMFKKMDVDGDGMITKIEFFASGRISRLPEEHREGIFARLDRDGDENISQQEVEEMRREGDERAREFRELDTDKSGGLNFAEFSQGRFFQKLPEEKRKEIFERMDTNSDGEVSPEDRPERPHRPERQQKGQKD